MARTVIFGLMATPRQYQCTLCGHVQTETTNHTDNCSAYCHRCSCFPSFGRAHNKEVCLFNRSYRPMQYVGPAIDKEAEANPYSKLIEAEREDLVTEFVQP